MIKLILINYNKERDTTNITDMYKMVTGRKKLEKKDKEKQEKGRHYEINKRKRNFHFSTYHGRPFPFS